MDQKIQNFLTGMQLLRELDPEIQAQSVCILLLIADKPGQSMREIADSLGVDLSAITRNVYKLGKNPRSSEGFGLVTVEVDPSDTRRKPLHLTKRGEEFIAKFKKAIS